MRRRRTTSLVLIALVSLPLFGLLYRCDNKYTSAGAQPIGGLLALGEADLAAQPLRFLIREWLYYPGALLGPADFAAGAPDLYRQYVFIGQYNGLNAGNPNRPRHGAGTYRLRLALPSAGRVYALELPEIYSAYRLYVGGALLAGAGEPDPARYRPGIRSRVVHFYGAGPTELLLAVGDHAAYYSGLTHPPAFGAPDAVQAARDLRLTLRVAAVLIAALALLLALYMGLRLPWRQGLLFALLCLCYIGYTGYPLLHAWFVTAFQPWYTIETGCYYAALALAVLLQNLHGRAGRRQAFWSGAPALGFAALATVYGACAARYGSGVVEACSFASAAVKYAVAAYLLAVALSAFLRRLSGAALLLTTSAFFACSLIADRLLPLYEPIYGGWFAEIGGTALVLGLAYVLWADLAAAYRFQLTYAEARRHMARQLSLQREHYQRLARQIEETRTARHDLRHYIRTLRALADKAAPGEIADYLQNLSRDAALAEPLSYTNHPTVDAVLQHYAAWAKRLGAEVDVLFPLPETLDFPDDDLCILLGNLLENAVEAIARQGAPAGGGPRAAGEGSGAPGGEGRAGVAAGGAAGDGRGVAGGEGDAGDKNAAPEGGARFLYLRGRLEAGRLVFVVENSFAGSDPKGSRYASSKARSDTGVGLVSVRAIVEHHGGLIDIAPRGGVFHVEVMIPVS